MKGTRTCIALALAVGGLLVLGIQGASAHTKRFPSEVTLGMRSTNGGQTTAWGGSAGSPREQCLTGRRVRVYRQIDGPDEQIGAGVTSGPGAGDPYSYSVHENGYPPDDGTYYAKMLREILSKTQRHKHVCAGAVSNHIEVVTPPPPDR